MASVMFSDSAIMIDRVAKSYRQYKKPSHRLLEDLSFGYLTFHQEIRVLRDISLQMKKGDCVGILGRNGSGKSTLLGIVAGTVVPSAGVVRRSGQVSAILELGTVFYPEVSGFENISIYGAALQIPPHKLEAKRKEIIDYSELGRAIDYPLRTYSSGMVAKLAFSVAVSVEPDILLIDEALAVGDIAFRHKAISTIQRMKASGVTILFVTHNPAQVIALADHALILEEGRIFDQGAPNVVVPKYQSMMMAASDRPLAPPASCLSKENLESHINRSGRRYGHGGARILGVGVYENGVGPVFAVATVSEMTVRISCEAERHIQYPNIGFLLKNEQGVTIAGFNLHMFGLFPEPFEPGEQHTAEFRVRLPRLERNTYSLHVAIADGLGRDGVYLEGIEQAYVLRVDHRDEVYGICRLDTKVSLS
jgi:ABC-type polysaccharide/polyol phosphate transport system ATPase subunit